MMKPLTYLEKVGGAHRSLAKSYFKLLDGDEWSQAYAEAQALWALREILTWRFNPLLERWSLCPSQPWIINPKSTYLLWASRAIAVAQPDVARQLLSLKVRRLLMTGVLPY